MTRLYAKTNDRSDERNGSLPKHASTFTAICARLTLLLALAGAPVWRARGSEPPHDEPGLREALRVVRTERGVALDLGRDELRLDLCRTDLLRVHYLPGKRESPQTVSIARSEWPAVEMRVDVADDLVTLATDRMLVRVTRKPCRVFVYDKDARLLLSESAAAGRPLKTAAFDTTAGSHFYGLKGWEYLDESGGQMEMASHAAPYLIKAGGEGNTGGPLLWSNRGYGLFVDTDGGYCEIRSDTEVRFTGLSREDLDYYVLVGTAAQIQTSVVELTGRPPLFPKWALGFANSEFAEMNEELAARNVAGYRSRGIPFDTYIFDFQWKAWGEDHYGEWRWSPVNFPSGPSGAFKKRMAVEGVKLGGIMKPRIHVDSEQGRYATEHGFWVPGRKPYEDYFSKATVNDLDFSKPECRTWFWEHAKGAFETGIVAWWNDEADAWGDTWANLHMQQAIYEGQRAATGDRVRVWSINRNYYSGAQRYAYATWSGDIDSGFHVMQQQRERLLCSVNVGQARWGMDTGGFNNHNGVKGEEYAESYARWMEFAAFVPVFRTHGCTYHQPWLFGSKAESAATKAIRVRYSLIPYLYAYDRRLHTSGVGIVRPLVWDYPDDPACFNRVDAWMVGDSLLVAPIVDKGQTAKEIYLPRGVWIDYFRGTRHEGGRTFSYRVSKDTWDDIPLFVKSGAIVPTMDVPNYVGEKPVEQVYLDVFPDARESRFDYYDDDGTSYDYEKGVYFSQTLGARASASRVEVRFARPTGTYRPETKTYLCRIHAPAATRVLLDGQELPRRAGEAAFASDERAEWTDSNDVYGAATLVRVPFGREATLVLEQAAATTAH